MNDEGQRLTQATRHSDGELVQFVLDSAADFAIITQDPTGVITSWSWGASRLLGWSEHEAIGQNAAMIFTPEQLALGVPCQEMDAASADGRAEDERWHQRQDGSLFWGSGLMMPLTDRGMGFVKIFRDRTAQHQAEARLTDSEERFRLLATNIPQLVFRSRGSGYRTWGSPQWEVFTGLSLESSVQFGWLDAIHADDRDATLAAWEKAWGTGEYYVEHRIRREPDGEYRWHQTRAKPVDGAADDWVGTSADIHDIRTLKDQQEVLLAELQHRTRNLLAVVQAVARQTERNSDTLDDFGVEFESRLRALSRVQGMLAQVDHQDIDLETLVRSELEAHGDGDAERLRIEGPPVALPANSAQAMALALHELATNAVKYGALCHSSGRLSILWSVTEENGEERVVLDWVESGVIMPEPSASRRRGYGVELIERALPYQLKAKTRLEFSPDGVRCWMSVPTARRQEKQAHG